MISIFLLAISIGGSAFAQTDETRDPGIVVVGERVQDYRDALARCLARNCPTNEDADATLALAEILFLAGGYREARDTVQASLRRNRDDARSFPEPVSDLYRAHSRLSRHLGFDDDGRRSAYGILRALREGIPEEDHRHFTARLEIADILLQPDGTRERYYSFRVARRELEQLARIARAAGREDVATIAELRILLYQDIAFADGEARAALIRISRLTDPANRMRMIGAKILLARIYLSEGKAAQANALLEELGRTASSQRRRTLIFAPAYELQVQGIATGVSIPDNFEDKWIDVGFWVTPDGRVSDLEILRHHNNTDWSRPLLRSMRGRRYSAGPEATYRMERYTYTASYVRRTGSRLPRRDEAARIEYLDLTVPGQQPGPPPTPETQTPSQR